MTYRIISVPMTERSGKFVLEGGKYIGELVPVEPEHQHQWLPWLALPNGSSWTRCTGCSEEVQFDHQ
jgi:hypothetical protein